MELLLNLMWLMLAIPAYWAWRHHPRQRSARQLRPFGVLTVFICCLVLLFPVISATDDLHPMRAEIEEPGLSKRTLRNLGTPGSPFGLKIVPQPMASVVSPQLLQPIFEKVDVVVAGDLTRPEAAFLRVCIGRAPPTSISL